MDERKIKEAIDTLRNLPYTKENEKIFKEVENIIAEKRYGSTCAPSALVQRVYESTLGSQITDNPEMSDKAIRMYWHLAKLLNRE